MRFENTRIEGVTLIRLDLQRDERGSFARTFCGAELRNVGIEFTPVQANLSRNSALHTLRGMHYQRPPHGEAKIVSCPRGRIWDVAVDMRPDSPSYRHWLGFELGEDGDRSLYLAEGIAHGFITLEPDSEVHYLMGTAFVPGAGEGIRWNDPAIGIEWPAEPLVMSERDRNYPLLDSRR